MGYLASRGSRNPLPSHRANKIKKQFDVSDQVVKWIGEVDPTKNGSYAEWVVGVLKRGGTTFPEDMEDTKKALYWYDRRKASLPKEMRDIFFFNTRGDLNQTLDEFALFPTSGKSLIPETVAWLKDGRQIDGLNIVMETNGHTVIEISDPYVLSEIAKNTSWCVKDSPYNENYMKLSNMFLIYLDKKRFYLFQPEIRICIKEDREKNAIIEEKAVEIIERQWSETYPFLVSKKVLDEISEIFEVRDLPRKTTIWAAIEDDVSRNRYRIAKELSRSITALDIEDHIGKAPSEGIFTFSGETFYGEPVWKRGAVFIKEQLKNKWDKDIEQTPAIRKIVKELNNLGLSYCIGASTLVYESDHMKDFIKKRLFEKLRPIVERKLLDEVKEAQRIAEEDERMDARRRLLPEYDDEEPIRTVEDYYFQDDNDDEEYDEDEDIDEEWGW